MDKFKHNTCPGRKCRGGHEVHKGFSNGYELYLVSFVTFVLKVLTYVIS